MPLTLPNEALTWLQNGEPATAGNAGGSEGVSNRPLVQLLANDAYIIDQLETFLGTEGITAAAIKTALGEGEGITNDDVETGAAITEAKLALSLVGVSRTVAGGTYANTGELAADVNNLQTQINAIDSTTGESVEINAALLRDEIPSGFLNQFSTVQGDDANYTDLNEDNIMAITKNGRVQLLRSDEFNSEVVVNGYRFNLRKTLASSFQKCQLYATEREDGGALNLIHSPASYVSGSPTKMDCVIFEFWKEDVDASTGHIFPYGNIYFENANQGAGTDGLAYAHSDKIVDVTSDSFAAYRDNPIHNIGLKDNGDYYQIRFRVRFQEVDHDTGSIENVKVQGPLAVPHANNLFYAEDKNETVTDANVSTANDTFTVTSNKWADLERVSLSGAGLPAELTENAIYYVIKVDATTIKLATTEANAIADTAIDITAGTGDTVIQSVDVPINDAGVFTGFDDAGTVIYGIPVARIHRRNRGVYDAEYNPNGTARLATGQSISSVADCFDVNKIACYDTNTRTFSAMSDIPTISLGQVTDGGTKYVTGYSVSKDSDDIHAGVSGRPDGKFFDQIYKGDVRDDRHNVSLSGFDLESLLDRSLDALFKGDLDTEMTRQQQRGAGGNYDENSGISGSRLLIEDSISSSAITTTTATRKQLATTANGADGAPDGIRRVWSDAPHIQFCHDWLIDQTHTVADTGWYEFTSSVHLGENDATVSPGTTDNIHIYYELTLGGVLSTIRLELKTHVSGDGPNSAADPAERYVQFVNPNALERTTTAQRSPYAVYIQDKASVDGAVSHPRDYNDWHKEETLTVTISGDGRTCDISGMPVNLDWETAPTNYIGVSFALKYPSGGGLTGSATGRYTIDDGTEVQKAALGTKPTNTMEYKDVMSQIGTPIFENLSFTLPGSGDYTVYLDDYLPYDLRGKDVIPAVGVKTSNQWWYDNGSNSGGAATDFNDLPTSGTDGIDIVWDETNRAVIMENKNAGNVSNCGLQISVINKDAPVYYGDSQSREINAIGRIHLIEYPAASFPGSGDWRTPGFFSGLTAPFGSTYLPSGQLSETGHDPTGTPCWIKEDDNGRHHLTYVYDTIAAGDGIDLRKGGFPTTGFKEQNWVVQNGDANKTPKVDHTVKFYYFRGWEDAVRSVNPTPQPSDTLNVSYETRATVGYSENNRDIIGLIPPKSKIISLAGTGKEDTSNSNTAWDTNVMAYPYLSSLINTIHNSYEYNPAASIQVNSEAIEISENATADWHEDVSAVRLPITNSVLVNKIIEDQVRNLKGSSLKFIRPSEAGSEFVAAPSGATGPSKESCSKPLVIYRAGTSKSEIAGAGVNFMSIVPNLWYFNHEIKGIVVEGTGGHGGTSGSPEATQVSTMFNLIGKPLVKKLENLGSSAGSEDEYRA